MNFGQALEAMKQGYCVRRVGWNGKGMHIYIENHFKYLIGKGGGLEHERKYGACIVMYTVQKIHQPGWLASQPDMLSDDWEIVPSKNAIAKPAIIKKPAICKRCRIAPFII